MNLSKKHKTPPKKPPRPRAALNKTVPLNTIRQLPPEVFDSDSSTSRKDESPDFGQNTDPGVMSPKSYLSMPSVKSFPRQVAFVIFAIVFVIVFMSLEQICQNLLIGF